MTWVRATVVLGALLLGCGVDEVELEGKQCPCASGWTCNTATNRCEHASGSGGSTSGGGGAAGTSGGAGATSGGGTTGGGGSGGGGGSTSGGGTTGGGGSGGGGAGAVKCGNSSCALATQMCCHVDQASQPQGQCMAKGGLCADTDMLCDDASDCAGGSVCCAEIDPGGEFKGEISCRLSCTSTGSGSVEILCDPFAALPCASGLSCKAALKVTGYSSCQP